MPSQVAASGWERLGISMVGDPVGRRDLHAPPTGMVMDCISCDSMRALQWKLPKQDLGRAMKHWSVVISYVHFSSSFKLSWSRQHMLLNLGERMTRCTEWMSKT